VCGTFFKDTKFIKYSLKKLNVTHFNVLITQFFYKNLLLISGEARKKIYAGANYKEFFFLNKHIKFKDKVYF